MLPPVLILAGGQGTRAREYLGDTPKFLAPIRDTVLGDLLLDYLYKQGVRKVILSLSGSNGADKIFKYIVQRGSPKDLIVSFSIPNQQLGILRSISYASAHYKDVENLIVINGDTLLKVDLQAAMTFHSVIPDSSTRIFSPTLEKYKHNGIIIYSKVALNSLSDHNTRAASLPKSSFIDIGTKEDWEKAQTWHNN